ncbi:MAG TPA: ABC transporter permease, partial [Vicinamibacterales bacterium]|nr:ABC transporter permease [Vicinamibacterales bacterium]
MRALPSRLRRVVRRLLRAPLFTIVAIVTLALGIGANTAIFSVVNGVLLKPLPFHEAGRLVAVWHTAPGLGFPEMNQSPATYLTYREENRTFEDIALWDNFSVSVTGTGDPERVQALLVTDGLLPILRITPAVGRVFSKEDDSPGAPQRVLITHAYWQRKFGGDPNIIGRGITVDGRPREIIGVLPASFRFLSYNPQLVVPFQINRAEVFVGGFSHQGIARLKPG